MATNYPTSLDTGSTTLRTDITATTELDDVGFYHDEQHVNAHGAVIAVETKLGVGSSDASAAGAGTVLVHSGSGSTGWSAAATGVTSVGTLSSLTVSGDVTVDTDTLHVDSTNNRVGIGTTSPQYALDVAGDIHIQNATPYLIFTDTDTNAESRISAASGAGSLIIEADYNNEVANTNIVFKSDGTEKMRINSSGNMGIGTTTPSQLLDINAGTSGSVELTTTGGRTIHLTANDSEPFLSVGSTTAHSAAIMTNGVRRLTVNSSGNVGINDTTPSYTLDVNGTGRFVGDVITDDLTVNCSSAELKVQGSVGGVQFITRDTGNRWVIYNSSSALRFYVDGSGDRLTLSDSGPDVLNFSANDANANRGIAFNNRTALSANYNDGWLRLNQAAEFSNGIYTPGNFRADGIIRIDDTRGITNVTGSYGTIQTTGSGIGGWEGYSVDGRVVFMANSSTGNFGIYDDTYNHWAIYADFNAWVQLNYDSSARVQTSSAGVNIWKTLRLLAIDATEGGEVQFDAGSSYTGSAGTYYMDMFQSAQRLFRSGGTGSYHLQFASGLPGTTAGSYMRIYGNRLYYYSSVADIKEDMYDSGELLEYLNERNPIHSVRPHIFHMKLIDNGDGTFTERSTGNFHHGFIADDFADAIPEAQTADGSGNLGGFDDAAISSLLTAEMQRIVPMLEELYAAAHPDWVPPQPRPPERIENEKAIFEAYLVEEKAKWDETQAQIQAKHPGPSDPPPEAQEVN